MGDLVPHLASYAVVPAIQGHMAECYGHCSVSRLASSGPDRPRDRLGPTYGGTIGYRGMVDPVPGFASCTVLDCRMPSTGLRVATMVGGL